MDKSYDPEQLGAALNERVQQSKTREEAEQALNERGPILIAVVADLNHLEFSAARPRKSTMVRAILDERFGKPEMPRYNEPGDPGSPAGFCGCTKNGRHVESEDNVCDACGETFDREPGY